MIKLNFSAIAWVSVAKSGYPLFDIEIENGETITDITQRQVLELSRRLNLDLRVTSR